MTNTHPHTNTHTVVTDPTARVGWVPAVQCSTFGDEVVEFVEHIYAGGVSVSILFDAAVLTVAHVHATERECLLSRLCDVVKTIITRLPYLSK